MHEDQTSQIPVPAFGNCFFISVLLGYLLPIIHDISEFDSRLENIISLSPEQRTTLRDNLLKNYKNLNYLKLDSQFIFLVTTFKSRLDISGWGGSLEDIQKTEQLLNIRIIDFQEEDETQDGVCVYILRCQPTPEEILCTTDDPELQRGKIASALESGDQRHFRVIDHQGKIQDAIDVADMDMVMAKPSALKKLKPTEDIPIDESINCGDARLLALDCEAAIENYTRAPDEPESIFRKAFALMISSHFDEARFFFEQAIERQGDLTYKIYYLTFYIDICWKIGETGFARSFREEVLAIKTPDADPTATLKFTLVNLKILVSDENPPCERILREMNTFIKAYITLSFEDKDNLNLIIDFFKLASRFAVLYFKNNKPELTSKIMTFISESYESLVNDIQSHTPFPNWCFDRVFISYQHALVVFYRTLSLKTHLAPVLLEKLHQQVAGIPAKFSAQAVRTGPQTFGDAGNNMSLLLLNTGFYSLYIADENPVKSLFSEITKQLRLLFPQQSVLLQSILSPHTESPPDTPPENDEPEEFNLGLKDFFELAYEKTIALMQRDFLHGSLYQHFEYVRDVYLQNPTALLRHKLSTLTLRFSLYPVPSEKTVTLHGILMTNIADYINIIEHHLPDSLLRYIHGKNLSTYFVDTLIPAMRSILLLLEMLPTIPHHEVKIFLTIVDTSLSKVEAFKRPDTKLSLGVTNCRRIYEQRVGALKQIGLEKDLAQAISSHQRDNLDVEYGKIPYLVPFPRSSLCEKLKDYQANQKIVASRNLSAHYLTLVFSAEKYQHGNKHTKQTLSFPIEVPHDENDVVGFEAQSQQNILSRIQLGWDISRANGMDALFPIPKPKVFSDVLHKHSEQHFFAYLFKHAATLFKAIAEKLPTESKIYMIAFDIASIRTSCQCCRLSALAAQTAQQEFVAQLQSFLKKQGFEVKILKATTRTLAQKDNDTDDGIPHKNPAIKNIKFLNNLGIFQSKEPSVFVSGRKDNARREFK